MALYYEDWYGDQDASNDKHLFECFTQLNSHIDALHNKIYIIRAFKGSGKTAFLEQLKYCSESKCESRETCPFDEKFCEEIGDYYVVPIDVTAISFQTLYSISSNVDPKFELTDMLTNIFKLILINSVVDRFKDRHSKHETYKNIAKLYKKDMITNTSKKILTSLFSALEKSLTQSNEFVSVVSNTFFESSCIDEIYSLCLKFLESINMTALMILDKFDTIIDLFKTSESDKYFYHQTIATSLLLIGYQGQSIENNEKVTFPNHKVLLKTLFPEDLYSTLLPRDKQKYDKHSKKLKWTFDDLKLFLENRLKKLLPDRMIKSGYRYSISNAIFSKKIKNTYYDISESSLEYILKHTLLKPRDIQEICLSITKEFIEKKNIRRKEVFLRSLPIDEASVKEGVKKGTQKIIQYILIEFEAFNLKKVFGLLRNKENIMSYGNLYNIFKEERLVSDLNITDIINLLWDIGVIGVIKEGNHEIHETYSKHKILKDKKVDNYYVSLFSYSWTNGTDFQNDDLIVLAPMFNDYLDLKLDKDKIIYNF